MRQTGSEIRRLRRASGVKPAEFAAKVKCSPQHLYNVENGHNTAGPELLHRIAKELGVDVEVISSSDAETDTQTDGGQQVPA